MPRVSVILPVRDAAPTLGAALRSALRQTLRDLELIVVDDGSSDGSRAIAEEVAARDARVRVIATPPRGVAAAANAGVAAARAPLVARTDADDVMHRDRLALQVAALEGASLDAVGTRVRLFPSANLGGGMARYERWLNGLATPADVARDRYIECPVANPSLMIRRDVLAGAGWRDRGWPEDWDLVLRLLADGRRIGVVPRRLHAWRHAPGRLTTDHPDYSLDAFMKCRAHHLARGFLGATDDYVLWGYGDTGRKLRAALAAEGKRAAWIVEVHPGRIGQVIHGAPVVARERLPTIPRRPIVVSVAGESPRGEVRNALARMGFEETVDYVCAA